MEAVKNLGDHSWSFGFFLGGAGCWSVGRLLLYGVGMNEAMKQAWLEVSRMLGEPTREELDVFLRTWQLALAAAKAMAEQPCDMGEMCLNCQPRGPNGECPDKQPAQREWVDLTVEEIQDCCATTLTPFGLHQARTLLEKFKEKNT